MFTTVWPEQRRGNVQTEGLRVAERPRRTEPRAASAAKRKQSCYAQLVLLLFFF
jgi:hypothetical protein